MNFPRPLATALAGLILSSCASTAPPQVSSCPFTATALQGCPASAFLLRDGTEEAKVEALTDAALNFQECRALHETLRAEAQACMKSAERLRKRLDAIYR
ncbi:MAG: hypothetical protein IPP91_11385 [Betaproteobacteria bacterium]|nr:hypothetical protein [Betaproteobacteria bacterium]